MATETFQVDPEAHRQAAAGEAPYTPEEGKPEARAPEGDKAPEAEASPDAKAEAQPEGETKLAIEPKTEEAAAPEALDFEAYANELVEKGDLSPETKALIQEATGVPLEIIEGYIEGMKALQQQTRSSVFDAVGGEANYRAMSEWARATLSEAEIVAYNEALDASPAARNLAIQGLHSRWQSAGGKEVSVAPTGAKVAASGSPAIQNRAQLVELIGSEKYRKDPAFRADVDRRLAQSMASGRYES